MRLRGFTLPLLLLLAAPVLAEPVIWKCEDFARLKEFSSIQCAPDAEVYIVDPTNRGQVGGDSPYDRRYIDFLNRHQIQNKAPKGEPSNEKKPETPAPTREGRNLDRFKSYSVTR